MNSATIKKIFNREFSGHTNLMTPIVLTYGKKNGHVYEISKGVGIFTDWIYGVTVLKLKENKNIVDKRADDKSSMFYSVKEAKEYCDNL